MLSDSVVTSLIYYLFILQKHRDVDISNISTTLGIFGGMELKKMEVSFVSKAERTASELEIEE